MNELSDHVLEEGMFVTIQDGWFNLMRGTLRAFDGRIETYTFRGHPLLVMKVGLEDDLVALSPCGTDDPAVWFRGPEECFDLPKGMGIANRDDHGKRVVRVIPQLVAVARRSHLLAWPYAKAPAANLNVPRFGQWWTNAKQFFDWCTAPKGMMAAIAAYKAAA